jgi:hypothetical protein
LKEKLKWVHLLCFDGLFLLDLEVFFETFSKKFDALVCKNPNEFEGL